MSMCSSTIFFFTVCVVVHMAFDFFNVSVQLQLYTLLYIQVDVIICEWMGYALLYESMLGRNYDISLFLFFLLNVSVSVHFC